MTDVNPSRPETDPDALPQVVVSQKHRISIVWLVPLLALGIAAYLAYDAIRSRGIPITIVFDDGSGLVAGKTQIKFNGVAVGTVNKFAIGPGMKSIIVQATLDKDAQAAAVEGTRFWVVRPEVDITGVTGLDALVTGAYIEFEPGQGEATYAFQGLTEAPPSDIQQPGITVRLRADSAGSLHVGSPLYYRQIRVGAVSGLQLADDSRHVLIEVHVDERYRPLIRENTVFWNASGFDFSLGVLGIGAHFDLESLESLLAGGVVLATPDEPGPMAQAGSVFELEPKPDDEYLKWSPHIPLKLSASSDSNTEAATNQPDETAQTTPTTTPESKEHRKLPKPRGPHHLR